MTTLSNNQRAIKLLPEVMHAISEAAKQLSATWKCYHVYDKVANELEIEVTVEFENESSLVPFVAAFEVVYGESKCDTLTKYGEFIIQDESQNLTIIGGFGKNGNPDDEGDKYISFRISNNAGYLQKL